MTNPAQFVGNSIEAMLVGIAEGIRDAQEALNAIPATDSFGRALPTYHLPYLDFTIAVTVNTEQTINGRPFIRLLPTKSDSQSSDLSSTVSGRFIASPPGEGLPTAQLSIASQPSSAGYTLRLTAFNSAGEILAGQRIELNIDTTASAALSGSPAPTGRLKDAIVITDESGAAQTEISFDAAAKPQSTLVVTALLGAAKASAAVVRP